MSRRPVYRGRFAPSPTGPLHAGSLLAALGSFLQARSQGGEWWLRIENIDPPREAPGATAAILRSLEAHGLHWDGEVRYQKDRESRYAEALQQLIASGRLYGCVCTRRDLAAARAATGHPRYPGTCRGRPARMAADQALRLDTRDASIRFDDAIQGLQSSQLEQAGGDFVLRRRDGLFSYQLAVALDDAEQGITEVVRGSDLLDSTPRQIYVQQLLQLPSPRYAHLPVLIDPGSGQKLSKQNRAPALDDSAVVANLWRALEQLGQQPPAELRHGDRDSLLEWAIRHWQLGSVPRLATIKAAPGSGGMSAVTGRVSEPC
jgi:glutamyl-Q tRNA(Asp) synthetase